MDMKAKKVNGFTIVEVLVVILLISLLAVILVPKLVQRVPEAKRRIAKTQIVALEQLMSQFMMDCGRYPSQTEGMQSLRDAPPGLNEKWKGPYAKESDLIDPWGTPFKYERPGTKNPNSFDIISYGSDCQPGGEGDNADIFND